MALSWWRWPVAEVVVELAALERGSEDPKLVVGGVEMREAVNDTRSSVMPVVSHYYYCDVDELVEHPLGGPNQMIGFT